MPDDTRLIIWTLYKHPLDAPDKWVIRGHDILRDGTTRPHNGAYFGGWRESVESAFTLDYPGLYWLGRRPEDEPQIVGSWV